MNNCYLSMDYPLVYMIYDREEIIDLFGEDCLDDYIDDYGKNVPKELIERYKINKEEFQKIQEELEPYYIKQR